MRAARLASAGDIPRRTFSSASMSRWISSSCSNSWSIGRGESDARARAANALIHASTGLPSLRAAQHATNDSGNAFPVPRFGMELFPSGSGEGIELGFSVVVRRAPGARNPSLVSETHKRSVDCSLIDLQGLFADLLDAASDSITMQRTHGLEGFQDHQVQRALE